MTTDVTIATVNTGNDSPPKESAIPKKVDTSAEKGIPNRSQYLPRTQMSMDCKSHMDMEIRSIDNHSLSG